MPSCRDFLAAPRSSVEAQVASSVAQLSQQLPGADLAGMMEHDPGLLFLDLKSGDDHSYCILHTHACTYGTPSTVSTTC